MTAATTPIKTICENCLYFRVYKGKRIRRTFCCFTGERIPAAWTCSFWSPSLGGPLEW
jgi:hypothetical protein